MKKVRSALHPSEPRPAWCSLQKQSGCKGLHATEQQASEAGPNYRCRRECVRFHDERKAHPMASYRPSTALLTRMLTATRRFCARPSAVELSATGSDSDMPVGVNMRYGAQPHCCCR